MDHLMASPAFGRYNNAVDLKFSLVTVPPCRRAALSGDGTCKSCAFGITIVNLPSFPYFRLEKSPPLRG